jgi:hypothetical protein
VTTSGMRRESRWGSVISTNGMAILCGDSANRFRFAKKRKTARRRAPSPAKAGGKKAGRDEEDHCSRIRPRVAWQQKSRTLSKRGEPMESHPSIAAVLGSRVLPRPERQYSGICSERELRFERPDHEPAKAVVGSRWKVSWIVEVEPNRHGRLSGSGLGSRTPI